jgi:hypothetical protein
MLDCMPNVEELNPPADKHMLCPGIKAEQSRAGLSFWSSLRVVPWAWAISQHESPGFAQYDIWSFGHGLVGAERLGQTISRQAKSRRTAMMRKKGNRVR